MSFNEAVKLAKQKYPKTITTEVKYGTAGFRDKADGLEFIMYRMGLLAVLRSCHKKAAIGVMITASHNPIPDNGVKLVDPSGEMLAPEWEVHATNLVSASDDTLAMALQAIVDECSIDLSTSPIVYIGRDTRPSSEGLRNAVCTGLTCLSSKVIDLGVVTTPVLHFVVTCHNDGGKYGEPNEEGYNKKLTDAFKKLHVNGSSKVKYSSEIFYDGANGVGALKISDLLPLIKGTLDITPCNNGEGVLNFMCGADYVKTQQRWPDGVPKKVNIRCVSVDGDADRIIYSYLDDDALFHLLDGDKIAALVAGYIQQLLNSSGLDLTMGLVQTAYANGASTNYIADKLGVPVACSKTGVKHLHHMALQFDVGIYFEANGHGTVIFSDKARTCITTAAKEGQTDAVRLSQIMNVINETVGDAISDMFLVETVLLSRDWSVNDWDEAYKDLPNKLLKVEVADRSVITTTDAERVCVTPEGLQEVINKLILKYNNARSFVRASGTENIVRVYAEAATRSETDSLGAEVAMAVYEYANGIGDKPKAAN